MVNVARPWVAGLFDGEGFSDSVIPVHDAQGITHTVRNFIREARQLRRERFDVAVLLQNAFGAALLARTANVKMIAGYPTDSRSALLDFVVPFEPNYKTAHQVRYYLNIASALEQKLTGSSHVEMNTLQPHLQVGREQQERVSLILEGSGVRTDEAPILTLCPGATNSRAKRWPAERLQEYLTVWATREFGSEHRALLKLGKTAAPADMERMRALELQFSCSLCPLARPLNASAD
jgi:heptosyltransferase-2